MPTRETEANAGVGPAAKQVAEHASSLARLEPQLGIGIGLGAGALLFVVFALAFVFATIAAGLATAVATWLALLITTGILFGLTALLAFLARTMIRKATPPLPEQAIEEARLTTEALKRDGHS